MNLSYYPFYRLLTSGAFLLLHPFLAGLLRMSGGREAAGNQRLGEYMRSPLEKPRGRPRLWLHAASVGEVSAAVGIVEALQAVLPQCAIVLSTMSVHGQRVAKEKLGGRVTIVFAPLDFVRTVRSALDFFQPDILVCVETEIWPNWLTEAQRSGIGTAMVNGRISVRSIRNYVRIRPLFQQILSRMNACSMIRQEDADRILQLGALPERVFVNGNAKYDPLIRKIAPEERERFTRLLNLSGKEAVFVAGSTRPSEETIILDVYERIRQRFPNTILILTPRHVERAYKIEALVKGRGLACQLRTDLDQSGHHREAPVVIMDTMGELQSMYGIATVVFCGGSLVPLGGHNILEAAAWGKPVLYGPHMDDFLDAKELLESAGGGFAVRDGDELAETALDLLAHPEKADEAGRKARAAVMANKGAAQKHADVILGLLRENGYRK
ncbi:MAG: 3-deoxy-D-manno-octulosonic acid transferase [Thermodesulfobacteriota bacterium]